MPQQKRPAVPHRPFPHERSNLERILQSNAHAIGILIHFIDDLLSPRSLIQVEAHIRGLDGEFQIFINLVAGVRVQFPRVVGRGEIGERAVDAGRIRGHVRGLGHRGVVGAVVVPGTQGVLQIFHERDVLEMQDHAPKAAGVVPEHLPCGDIGPAAAEAERAHRPRRVVLRQALGTVVRIAVVAAAVPRDDTGSGPIKGVIRAHGGIPARTIQLERAGAVGKALIPRDFPHLHTAIGEIPGDGERRKRIRFGGDAEPPRVFVGFRIPAEGERLKRVAAAENGIQTGPGSPCRRIAALDVPHEALGAHKAEHAPRRNLHHVRFDGHDQAEQVHGVAGGIPRRPVGLRAVAVPAAEIAVERPGPEERRPDLVGPLLRQHDAGHVMTEYRAESRRHESGEDDRLEAHADAQIRVRNLPVDVRIADFDILGVGPQRAALGSLAPVGVPDFKEHDALEGIRRNDFHLRTQALQGGEPIIRPVQRSDVAPFRQNLPCAFGLDLDGSGGRRRPTEHPQRQTK